LHIIIQQNLRFKENYKKKALKNREKKSCKITRILQRNKGCNTKSRSTRRHHFMTLTKQTKAVPYYTNQIFTSKL